MEQVHHWRAPRLSTSLTTTAEQQPRQGTIQHQPARQALGRGQELCCMMPRTLSELIRLAGMLCPRREVSHPARPLPFRMISNTSRDLRYTEVVCWGVYSSFIIPGLRVLVRMPIVACRAPRHALRNTHPHPQSLVHLGWTRHALAEGQATTGPRAQRRLWRN